MKHRNQHVVPREDNWAVVNSGDNKNSKVFTTKGEAIAQALETASINNGCMVIHDRTGKFEEFDCELKIKNQYVVPYENGKWAVVTAKRRVTQVFNTKRAAMKHANIVSTYNNVCMVVHDTSGKFKYKNC